MSIKARETRPIEIPSISESVDTSDLANIGLQGEEIILTAEGTDQTVWTSLFVDPLTDTSDVLGRQNLAEESTKPVVPAMARRLGLAAKARSILAAAYVDFVNFSPVENSGIAIEPSNLLARIQQSRSSSITVSPRLHISRENALATTLLAPSGAYLSWMEMLAEDGSER